MKEHPILFSGEMVRAILDGRKTMTRRIVKGVHPDAKTSLVMIDSAQFFDEFKRYVGYALCPYGSIGDRLWVRETFAYPNDQCTIYRANWKEDARARGMDHIPDTDENIQWKPSIFMPRAESRITLEITNIRVERLQDVSEVDAKAEGVSSFYAPSNPPQIDKTYGVIPDVFVSARECFIELWDIINGKRASWASNPFVWVVEFRRVDATT